MFDYPTPAALASYISIRGISADSVNSATSVAGIANLAVQQREATTKVVGWAAGMASPGKGFYTSECCRVQVAETAQDVRLLDMSALLHAAPAQRLYCTMECITPVPMDRWDCENAAEVSQVSSASLALLLY